MVRKIVTQRRMSSSRPRQGQTKADLVNSSSVLERFSGNPIIEPLVNHWWESKAVFNPAAIYEGGKVHIMYRAIGDSDMSVLGYASSTDGFHVDERLEKPAYIPREPFEGAGVVHKTVEDYVQPEVSYVSGGGGWGGTEDPRLTRIDDKIYMTYVAYNGWGPPRVALTSIHVNDFLARNWQWERPVLISPPGIVDKNACILPEKIGSKYVIFHRIFPDILIDFVNDLDFDGETRWLNGEYKISPRAPMYWDSRKIGAGPPPIKTKEGWLFIYQSVGELDSGRYKIGAMLLDLKDPTRVTSRLSYPILEPNAIYENDGWKAGVVYPCGAAVINNRLFVYYGGADKVTCVATIQMDDLLNRMEGVTARAAATPSTPARTPSATAPGSFKESPVPARTTPVKRAAARPAARQNEAYCVKCHTRTNIKTPEKVTTKNGRHAVRGICPICGSKMFRMTK